MNIDAPPLGAAVLAIVYGDEGDGTIHVTFNAAIVGNGPPTCLINGVAAAGSTLLSNTEAEYTTGGTVAEGDKIEVTYPIDIGLYGPNVVAGRSVLYLLPPT